MWSLLPRRSVAKKPLYSHLWNVFAGYYRKAGSVTMLKTLEERVSTSAPYLQHEKFYSKDAAYSPPKKSTDIDAEYEEAIKTLNTLQANAATIRRSIKVNNKQTPLDFTYRFLRRSGLDMKDLEKLSVIHVSGTKGKGATCALTESILREHGIKTGFFSSPHLVSITERIRINGEPIPKQCFTRAFWRVYRRLEEAAAAATAASPTADREDEMPAYFQFLTILSFHIFLEEQVDVSIMEVGIGGELDCTNIISNTKTVGITSLGLEHTNLLGDTIEEIAWQKAGIIKPHSHVYTSVKQPECLKVLRERAAEKNVNLYTVPEFSAYFQNESYKEQLSCLNNIIKLNGSLAIQLGYDWLRQSKLINGADYPPNTVALTDKVLKGLLNCHWPGRYQIQRFLNLNLHIDGAHTIESMRICGDWFQQATAHNGKPKILIFNTTGDRDSKKLLDILRQQTDFSMACFMPNIAAGNGAGHSSENQPIYGIAEQMKRAKLNASIWHMLCMEAGEPDNSSVHGSILDSLHYMRQRFAETQELDVLVTGSLHLIGATLLAVNEYKQRISKLCK